MNIDVTIQMADALTFVIEGEPVAWQRTGKGKRGQLYTQSKARQWKEMARKIAAIKMMGHEMMAGPVYLHVTAIFPVPPSWPKWKREMALNKQVVHTGKPDGDNVLKAVMDAFNGIVWTDDSQVVVGIWSKRYGETPAIVADVGIMDNVISSSVSKRPE